MSAPSQRHPARSPDESLEILRRLEPVLGHLVDDVRKLQIDRTEVKGQLKYVPSIWQIVGAITAINGTTLALAFGVVKLIQAAS